tara:strand:+ start:12151 stop:12369 length:219 start_codon:yes stop_codon:yes gene_type:complete
MTNIAPVPRAAHTPIHPYEDKTFMLILRAREALGDILDAHDNIDPENELSVLEQDLNLHVAQKAMSAPIVAV